MSKKKGHYEWGDIGNARNANEALDNMMNKKWVSDEKPKQGNGNFVLICFAVFAIWMVGNFCGLW